MKIPMFFSPKVAAVLLGAALVLSACGLDTSGTHRSRPFTADVQPPNVCPGDNVTLSWDVDEGISCTGRSCPDPVRVGLSSDPGYVIGGSWVGEATGTRMAGPINVLTTFTFMKTGGYYRSPDQTRSVNVILPSRETNIDLNFQSSCSGSRAVWSPVDLSVPLFRSNAVRLVHVCNPTSSDVYFILNFSSGPPWPVRTLMPRMCTEDLPVDQGRSVTTVSAWTTVLAPVSCDVSSSLPPDIHLTGVLTCDVMTGGGALVAASPEVPTKEATPPGIIYVASPTPTTTPTASPTAVPSFGQPSLSTDHYYSGGAGCGPLDLKLQIGVANPDQVSSVELFFHLEDKAGSGKTPWNNGVGMTSLGQGKYEYDLLSNAIPAFNSYPEAWLVYQFVATGAGGQVLLRSPVYSNVTLSMCGKK